MGLSMQEYRVYTLVNGNRHKGPPPLVLTCNTDQEALDQAVHLIDGYAVEVWEGAQCVGTLRPRERR